MQVRASLCPGTFFVLEGLGFGCDLWSMQVEEILGQAGRSAIIELILATDMKQHFSLVSRLQVGLRAAALRMAGMQLKV